jgi:hypothetical protein
MATYYRWRQSEVVINETQNTISMLDETFANGVTKYVNVWASSEKPDVLFLNGSPVYKFTSSNFLDYIEISGNEIFSQKTIPIPNNQYFIVHIFSVLENELKYSDTCFQNKTGQTIYITTTGSISKTNVIVQFALNSGGTNTTSATQFTVSAEAGDFIQYVYSTTASAYPNDGVSGSNWYNQRTPITSPVAPTGLTYPNPIITSSATVSWTASVINVPIYAVSTYEVSYSTNGGSTWTVAGTTADTSLSVNLPAWATSIQFRVRAQDSNGQWSSYATGTASTVLLSPTLTVPSMAMQGQQITVNWTAIDGATSYTLQRQANTDDGWVQVYSGNALTFTETVGTWTTVQYQVQAVFSSGAGGWATSDSIPVVSAAALVISGQDEDLGLITHDVPYTVSTDTGNPISLTRTVNGVQVASLTVENGFAYDIPVMDLPTGEGTIVISASVNTSSGAPVTATRTWTYTKTEFSFPNVGSTAQLTLQGENVFPATLAECVRVGANLGGDLGHALEMIAPFILNGARVEVGSYTGTGTYGESNPSKLTFSFPPKIVFIADTAASENSAVTPILYGVPEFNVSLTATVQNNCSWSGNTLTFYVTSGTTPLYQLNADGRLYIYAAIG